MDIFWSVVNSALSKRCTVNAICAPQQAPRPLEPASERQHPKTSISEKQWGLHSDLKGCRELRYSLKGLTGRLTHPGAQRKSSNLKLTRLFVKEIHLLDLESVWGEGTCWDSLRDGGTGGHSFLHSPPLQGLSGVCSSLISQRECSTLHSPAASLKPVSKHRPHRSPSLITWLCWSEEHEFLNPTRL